MSKPVFRTIVAAAAVLLIVPGIGLAQQKVPFPGTPPAPLPVDGTLPGTSCTGSGGTNCPAAIPDNNPAGLTSTFSFSGCDNIADVNVGLDVTHTWIGDLIVDVQSPGGPTVRLLDQPGLPLVNATFGCNDNNIFATLDDEAGSAAEDACSGVEATPGISGTFTPTGNLSDFDGLTADGTWTLVISDNAGADSGTLNDWSLEIACATTADLSLTKVGTNTGGGTGVYTLTVTNNGPDDDTNVVVTDTLPAGVAYVSDDCGGMFAAPTFTWNVGSLANGASAVCNVSVNVVDPDDTANSASVSGDSTDPNQANNAAGTIIGGSVLEIPTLGELGLVALLLALAGAAIFLLRRRGQEA